VRRTLLLSLSALALPACARLSGEPCECPNAHGAVYDDRCVCMPPGLAGGGGPGFRSEFYVDPDVQPGGDGSQASPWTQVDWDAVDAALNQGFVAVYFSATTADGSEAQDIPGPLVVRRSDQGRNLLLLDGRRWTNTSDTSPSWELARGRARVAGIRTPYEDGVYSNITVSGFEITGSKDKGVYWRAGDDVALVDLVVHDNGGTPAINLEYSNRTGHRSERFRVVGCHVYNQPGECIYIGGSEGQDEPSHHRVEIVGNLIHHCRDPYGSKNDGINVKDNIGEVLVEGNVVYETDWGIEVASPGRYAHNLVLDTAREGVQISDVFNPISDLVLEDNVVVRPGHDGVHITADQQRATGLELRRTTVIEAGQAGLLVGGEAGLDLVVDQLAVFDSAVGLDGWGQGQAQVQACTVGGNQLDADRVLADASCASADAPDASRPEGDDGTWLTADDAGYVSGGARAR